MLSEDQPYGLRGRVKCLTSEDYLVREALWL